MLLLSRRCAKYSMLSLVHSEWRVVVVVVVVVVVDLRDTDGNDRKPPAPRRQRRRQRKRSLGDSRRPRRRNVLLLSVFQEISRNRKRQQSKTFNLALSLYIGKRVRPVKGCMLHLLMARSFFRSSLTLHQLDFHCHLQNQKFYSW